MIFESCIQKQGEIKNIFSEYNSDTQKYEKIIQLGRDLPKIDPTLKTEDRLVKGCQSQMYLYSYLKDGKIHFEAEADALISAGLAALLLYVYNDEPPETVLKCPPSFIDEIGLYSTLTPSRANGLYSLHLQMQQDTLKLLTNR